MTKQEALQLTAQIWRWLEQHPESSKVGAVLQTGITRRLVHYCPCCAFVEEFVETYWPYEVSGFACSNLREEGGAAEKMIRLCPLMDLWPLGCESEESPYRKWHSLRPGDPRRVGFAKQIADAAELELSKITQSPEQRVTPEVTSQP